MSEGVKYDGFEIDGKWLSEKVYSVKPRWDLMPVEPMEDVVKVLTYGAVKYSDDNWKKVKPFEKRYYSAAMRHIMAWKKGEIEDVESGLPHLAHAITNLLFLMQGGEDER